MIPSTYQSSADKGYQRWSAGNINMIELDRRKNPDNDHIYINGVLVYELVFEGGKKWNCKFGWLEKGML
jgi:hypothetical protein